MKSIGFALVILGVLGLTAWVFYLTRSPWSFAILLLAAGAEYEEKKNA